MPLILAIASCDNEVVPIAPTEMTFTVYGHLDALADTQWIRVGAFRPSIYSSPDPVDATVFVEDLATGRTIEMIATPFAQGSGNFGDSLFAYNFRTSEALDFASTYRVTAVRSDGASASSLAVIPPDHSHLPTIVGRRQPAATPNAPDYVRFHLLPGTHVAMVHSRRYSSTDPACRHRTYNSLPFSRPPTDTGGEIQVNVVPPGFPGNCAADRTDIGIVRSTAAWPFDGRNDYTNFGSFSNIENGVGYLGGVTITSIPVEGCSLTGPGRPTFCELYYAPDSAVLFVRPINVSGFPHDYPVEDPENYPFAASGTLRRGEETWTRRPGSTQSTGDLNAPGIYRFPALRPGVYTIRVEGGIGVFPLYCEERTLDLPPGETSIDIQMTMPEIHPGEPVNANGCREG